MSTQKERQRAQQVRNSRNAEIMRLEAEDTRLRAALAEARDVMTKISDLAYSECDEPLDAAISLARAFLERTNTGGAADTKKEAAPKRPQV